MQNWHSFVVSTLSEPDDTRYVLDLANGFDLGDLGDLSAGAFGPTAGYLLIGVAALVGPRRFT